MADKIYNIFCDGPSLDEHIENKVNKTIPSIAVNETIYRVDREVIDYWLFLDKEHYLERMDEFSKQVDEESTTIVTEESIEQYDTSPISKFPRKYYIPAGQGRIEKALGFGEGVMWNSFSTLGAMVFCSLNMADEVRIYGNDMEGDPYDEKFWRRMRSNFINAKTCMERNGIKVINY